jgi:23S rRNA (cytosine1962-C5)-methyltransferase
MTYPKLTLRKGSQRSLVNGHPWVYSGAVSQAPDDIAPGDIVDLIDHRERFIGRGSYNPHSSIRVRIFTRVQECPIDQAFFRQAIARAHQLRQQSSLPGRTNAYRIVHGESDGLPGLVVDRYNDFLVVQFHTLGMERFRADILDVLSTLLQPRGIYERSDVGTRRAEGLPDRPAGPLRGAQPPEFIQIEECGTPLIVDLYNGQKTGFFLDQRENRALLQSLSQNQSVLNCFAYTSGFSAHALKGSARRTLDVDIALSALPTARQNLAANRPAESRCDYLTADVFPFIDELAERGPRFDIVVLDPPSLLRKRSDFKKAMGIYTKLNRNALKLVHSGGLLVTSSCSGRISQEDFFHILQRAATSAQVDTRILAYNLHALDHPVDPAFPEGRYLKCIFARVFR